jgi:N-dimethylarginine dimethylaminohydrolase
MSTQPIEIAAVLPPLPTAPATFLMCPPRLYDVTYVINPWMAGNLHASSQSRAVAQWQHLYEAVSSIANVELIDPQPGSPDMVFTANAGLERNCTVAISSFFHPERQGEEPHFRRWFAAAGYTILDIPRATPFEGEGDALFYHLDTCFAPLEDGSILYYPDAFDRASIERIEAFYPADKRILVTEADALRFACNAINVDQTIILNQVSGELSSQLEAKGFHVIQIQLSEFLKAGGAAKCLVMKLSPPVI